MRQHRRVRLEPVPRQWLAQFVTGILRAVERLPFTSGRLVFGSDEPALDVRRLSEKHLAAGSRYEYRVAALSDADPAPLGYLTVRSWEPAGTTSAGTAATNLLATGDLVTGRLEVDPNALTCTATYDAIGTLPRLAELLRLQARIDLDLDAWWSGHGNPAAAPLRAELTHAVASATLEVTSPVLVDGRWEVAVTIEVDGQWWAQPLLRLALDYGQQILSRRYGSEPGELVSFEAAVDIVADAWNDTMPGLTQQSPSRLADQLLADAVFDPE
jgi:hypothetical protein